MQALSEIEKTKFSMKAIVPNGEGNIFGIVISGILIIMFWKKSIAYVNPKTRGNKL